MNTFKQLMAACLVTACLVPVAMQAEHVVILAVNDTHSQIDPARDGKGGVLRRRAIYDSERRSNKNCLLVHAGDAVQGTNYFSLYGGQVEFSLMDSLAYDMVIMGNHEFDNGVDSLATFYNKLKPVKLSANYDLSATPIKGFKPFEIKTYGDKRIGFFGISVNPRGMVSDVNSKGIRYISSMKVADATAKYLKEVMGVDYAVMISHIGYDSMEPSEPNDSIIAATSHYIDFIIGGHSHSVIKPGSAYSLVKNADGKVVTIGQNGKSGKIVGKYDLDLETGKVVYSHIPVDETWDNAAKAYPALEAWLSPFKRGVDSLENNVVGMSAKRMRNSSWTAMNFVTDALMGIIPKLYKGRVDCAIMNKGGIRTDIPQGKISEGLIQSIFPFDNRLMVIEITGRDLLDALNVMAYRDGDAVSKQLRATYNAKKQITSAKLNGKKINPEQKYCIVTIDFLANGGDFLTSFKNGNVLFKDNARYGVHILQYIKDLTAQGKMVDADDAPRMVMQ